VESSYVEAHNIFHGQNNVTCIIKCKYRPAATIYTLETRFVSGIWLEIPFIEVVRMMMIIIIIITITITTKSTTLSWT
jgi:hypothetical protein